MLTLITGASAGLGAEMARQLADLGHDLVLTARRVDRLEELRGEITARHPELRVEVAALDVTDEDQVFEVFRRFAPLERVIVNAGLRHSNIVGTGEHANNLALARTNFVAAATQIEAAMEQFRAQGHGHLVVISSVAAMRGLRGSPAVYAATKRGLGTSQKACAPRCCTQSCRSRSRPSTRGTSEPRRPASRPTHPSPSTPRRACARSSAASRATRRPRSRRDSRRLGRTSPVGAPLRGRNDYPAISSERFALRGFGEPGGACVPAFASISGGALVTTSAAGQGVSESSQTGARDSDLPVRGNRSRECRGWTRRAGRWLGAMNWAR
jgi:NADP-dependent 3-hydroxy acid dehydrogenase YdfG